MYHKTSTDRGHNLFGICLTSPLSIGHYFDGEDKENPSLLGYLNIGQTKIFFLIRLKYSVMACHFDDDIRF